MKNTYTILYSAVFMSTEPAVNATKKSIQTRMQSMSPTISNIVSCLYCTLGHALEHRPQLRKWTHREKLDFLKEKGVCFGCLCIGHMSKDYNKRISCKVCNQSNASIRHIEKRKEAKVKISQRNRW